MEHRYQVFISSTYRDLVLERTKVAEAVLDADCFPAGMESFPATDDEQFDYIKQVIRQSDYYVLIIGWRYGSVGADGISFTEKEFDFAVEIGLPILVFAHADSSAMLEEFVDREEESKAALLRFRTKALDGRLGKLWVDAENLSGQVMRSLLKVIRDRPGVGWLRGSVEQISERDQEISLLKERVVSLQSEVSRLSGILDNPRSDLSAGEDRVELSYRYSWRSQRSINYDNDSETKSWNEIFVFIGPDLLTWVSEHVVSSEIAKMLGRAKHSDVRELTKDSLRTVYMQWIALGLIERKSLSTTNNGVAIFWRLTEKGSHLLFRLRPLKRPE